MFNRFDLISIGEEFGRTEAELNEEIALSMNVKLKNLKRQKQNAYLKIFLILGFIGLIHTNPDVYSNNFKGVVAIVGESSLGSGAIISKDGLVLTNWHVLDGQKNLKVFLLMTLIMSFQKT